MPDWLTDVLGSQPMIVLLTLLLVALMVLAAWASPVGKWVSERWAESRQMRQIELLREFNTELEPVRAAETTKIVKEALNGHLPRIEQGVQGLASQLDRAVASAAERDAVVQARLATGTAKMEENAENISKNRVAIGEAVREVTYLRGEVAGMQKTMEKRA